ncbi:helix-turn-helix domain-containing protein [Rhodoblastus sp.]|uniref:helix-turn-helix domain-containing protein n=1 Tax=Rhodoblastus sp. TaxID=1962975 RepID=UPI003F9C5448
MKNDYPYLPGILAEIAEAAGLPAALALAEKFGGSQVYIPGKPPEWLIVLVGSEAAEKISAHFRVRQAGDRLLIPLGPNNFYAKARRRAAEMTAQGASAREIALALGIHERSVKRARASARRRGACQQGSLF